MLYVGIPFHDYYSFLTSRVLGCPDLDGNRIYRGRKSPATGHVEATYSTLWPSYMHPFNWCLIISYDRNCVNDDEDLWLEVRAACDFARAITEGRKVSCSTL